MYNAQVKNNKEKFIFVTLLRKEKRISWTFLERASKQIAP
jgi:hypothetical protein